MLNGLEKSLERHLPIESLKWKTDPEPLRHFVRSKWPDADGAVLVAGLA
jgi:hypothetical protein